MKMNKKAEIEAGEMIMIFGFILILLVLFFSIWLGAVFFFGTKYDSRKIDANILNYKIKKCIEENKISFEILKSELENEILNKCKINKNILENSMLILIKQNENQLLKLGKGDEVQCNLGEKNEQFPKCKISNLIQNQVNYKLITGSNQNSIERLT